MNFTAHQLISKLALSLVSESIFPSQKDRKKIIEYSTLLDYIDDTLVKGYGKTIFGKPVTPFSHFAVPNKKIFHGYSMKLDKSIAFPDFPDANVLWLPNAWRGYGSSKGILLKHPLNELLKLDINKSFDEITWPSIISVAEWGWSCFKEKNLPLAIAIVSHAIADCCTPCHTRGWLGKGHVEWENEQESYLIKNENSLYDSLDVTRNMYGFGDNADTFGSIRHNLEFITYTTSNCGFERTEKSFHRSSLLAIEYVARFVASCFQK